MRKGSAFISICCLLVAAACAYGAEVTFREGGGSGYIGLKWDVVSIITTSEWEDPPVNDSDWTSQAIRVSGDPSWPAQGADQYYVLLGMKDLLATLPLASGQITSATLTLTGCSGDYASVVAYRVTTDWLAYWGWPAGLNEQNVTGWWRIDSWLGWGNTWESPPETGHFSSSDYDDTEATTGAWGAAYQQPLELDVTDQVKAMYTAEENYGWAVTNVDAGDEDITIYNAGGGGPQAFYPSLRIEYTSQGAYTLTVNTGSGGGSYAAGTLVEVTADAPPTGFAFTGWFGDTLWLWDTDQAETTVLMPPYGIEITASYGIPILWIRQFGTAQDDVARGVSVDGSGNVFVGGETSGELVEGQYVGLQDIFIRKYTSSGVECWTDQRGSTENDVRVGVSADANGNVYFCGRTYGAFAGQQHVGLMDIFLGQYDPSGELLWCDEFGTASEDHGTRVIVGESGHVHISGCTQGDLYPNDGPNDPTGSWDCFVATYDDSGDLLWSDQFGDTGHITISECNGAAPDTLGNLYLVGITNGHLAGQGDSFGTYVRKYDDSGDPVWTDQFATDPLDFYFPWVATAAVTDAEGNLYVAGNTTHSIDGEYYADYGDLDVYLRKYSHDSTGTRAWTRLVGTGDRDCCSGSIAVDSLGNVYVGGITGGALGQREFGGGDIFLAKYDGSGNRLGVVIQFGTSAYDDGISVATDSWGNIYIVGETWGDLEGPGANAGGSDAFIAKLGLSYALTVNSGSGDGSYAGGSVVNIQADAAPSGYMFDAWTGDTAGVADVNVAATTFTMPAADATVTATYRQPYLTVNSGSGDGQHAVSSVVNIQADTAPTGLKFWKWVGDTAGLASTTAASTTCTMPASDVEITARYTYRGDLDCDGFVGQADMNIVLADWGHTVPPGDPRADPSGDNFVGQADLNIVLADWGKSAP